MIKNHYSADIQSFKNALSLLGTSQEKLKGMLLELSFKKNV